jgi:CRP-like cAMP-binding protein
MILSHPDSPLAPLVKKLQRWSVLDEGDRVAVLALPHVVRHLAVHEHVVREGDRPQYACLLLAGYAYRYKIAGNGGRQILSIHMRGDLVDLQNSLLKTADHNVQALTKVEAAFIPVEAVREIAFERPSVGVALWYETLIDASIFREWTLNVGRRNARTRTAHLLCEFALRLDLEGLGGRGGYELPMTQEELGDALALTPVHVNRTLKALGEEGYISRTRRSVTITDWERLAKVGDFDSRYLHLRDALPAPA